MIGALFYYVVIPMAFGGFLIKLIRKYSPYVVPADVAENLRRQPLPKKWFRAVRRDAEGLRTLGDFETHVEAVDCAYAGKEKDAAAGRKAAFLILNPKGEVLEQVDAPGPRP